MRVSRRRSLVSSSELCPPTLPGPLCEEHAGYGGDREAQGARSGPARDLCRLRQREPDRLWVADITYVRSKEGIIYLAFILDACSRRVVGWSMATHLKTELVVDALQMAIARRKPAPGLVHHSDRGVQ